MTNGEKIQHDFECEVCDPIIEDNIIHVIFADKSDSAIGFDLDWWNAEYKESTTPNDCETCIHNKGVLECDMYGCKYEPTTKKNLAVDTISRADARSLICNTDIKHHMSGMSRKVFKDLYNGMDELPTVTPIRPKGHWIPVYQGDEIIDYRCSECEFGNTFGKGTIGMDFCPRCGSDNREVEE